MARRSSAVQLTLLPVLATAAVAAMAGVASADVPSIADDPPPMQPMSAGIQGQVELAPPGMVTPGSAAPELAPPGMTPTIMQLECENDPNWRLRDDCPEDDGVYWYDGGAIRGGFGTYFHGGGGGYHGGYGG